MHGVLVNACARVIFVGAEGDENCVDEVGGRVGWWWTTGGGVGGGGVGEEARGDRVEGCDGAGEDVDVGFGEEGGVLGGQFGGGADVEVDAFGLPGIL